MQVYEQAQQSDDQTDPMMDDGYYQRQYGGFKPRFKGTTVGYFPLEYIDMVYISIFTMFTWAVLIGPWYGILQAGLANSKQLGIVSCIVFVGFFMIMIFGMYFVGKMKRIAEKEMIQKKLQLLQEQQAKEQKEKEIELEENANLVQLKKL